MRRRDFLLAAAWPLAARAQPGSQTPRLGLLWVNSAEAEAKIGLTAVFRARLRELGYVEGRTILIEERFCDGDERRLNAGAAELVRLPVDLIVTGAEGVIAAARATKTTPIVATATGDPVAEGLAVSLAHPGGNVTGSAVFFPQIMAKRVELLKQAAPSIRRVGALAPVDVPFFRIVAGIMAATAKPLGVEVKLVTAPDAASYEQIFAAAPTNGLDGFVILDSAQYGADFEILSALAAKYRTPAGGPPPYVHAGGLLGYGADVPRLFRNAAVFVDKILKGEKAGDIPIEQAAKFETAVNLKTARALGLDIPPSVLGAADEVIE